MCRWLAYSGSSDLARGAAVKPAHSLLDQSMHSRLGATTTTGDGFGVGWYVDGRPPGVFRAVGPAWSDRNLRELAGHIASPLFVAHIRASTGTAVQQTNCHPFRHGRWLWVHNGLIRDFPQLKRDLMLAVDPSLYPAIEGSADSEVMFYLALTFGLEHDPPAAVAQMAGFVEATARRHGIPDPLQMTTGTSDGERVWAFRYSSQGQSRSLFYSTKLHTLRQLYPDNPVLHDLAEETRLVVSEPLGDLAGAWNEVPESSYGVVHHGHDELHPFRPPLP